MTLSASSKTSGSTELVTIRACYGPITFEIDEQRGHVLHFWHDLGKIVAAEDNKRRAKAGYTRYIEDCGRVSVNGDALPEWEGLPEKIRGHWIAAFTE